MSLGLYVSIPFCPSKCSYCNFASNVFSRTLFQDYVERVASGIENAGETAKRMGGLFERSVNSIYLGGGTPTILDITQLKHLFVTISQNFDVETDAEITVECAPGTLTSAMLGLFQHCGVNRVSLGVQSYVDAEAASVGRLHKRATVLNDITRVRAIGIENINIDLIAGLPHQTASSWQFSLAEVIASRAPHVSVYMLEIDNDSRLGRELMADGTRYHAHFVPNDELTAELYETACERLDAAGVRQYEISNFARPGYESRHNRKYWTRQPYLGFGVDAHSMLSCLGEEYEAVRFSWPDSLEVYLAGTAPQKSPISYNAALEEAFFVGLRLTEGVDLERLAANFGEAKVNAFSDAIAECVESGLLQREGNVIRLTGCGRLLSNEVFERFILTDRLDSLPA